MLNLAMKMMLDLSALTIEEVMGCLMVVDDRKLSPIEPKVSHLHVFSYVMFIKELGHVGKLDDRRAPLVFIGYVDNMKAYRILDPVTQCVRIAHDVVFDEG